MRQRKSFADTALPLACVTVHPQDLPPSFKVIYFGRNAQTTRSFSFQHWQNKRIDSIVLLLQSIVEQMLNSKAREAATLVSMCSSGANSFMNFCAEQAQLLDRDLFLVDIDRAFIDHFIAWLGRQPIVGGTGIISYVTQKSHYSKAKSLLIEACKTGLLPERQKLFPSNPFPGSKQVNKSLLTTPGKTLNAPSLSRGRLGWGWVL